MKGQLSKYRFHILAIAAIVMFFPLRAFVQTVVTDPSAPARGVQPPRILYTDLTSGPSTGGQQNNGTILTIYGRRFGPARDTSTVTVGGGAVADYLLWSDTKVSVAIGPNAATGNVVVHTTLGDSNGLPFTVRPGNIWCVSTSGTDTNSGHFPNQCWATLIKAVNTMVAGDITYAMNGVTQDTLDHYKATLVISSSGTVGDPIALVAYPGATVNVGTPGFSDPNGNLVRDGIQADGYVTTDHWVIAGLHITGIQAMNLLGYVPGTKNYWRVVGNDLTCPDGTSGLPKGYYPRAEGYAGFGCIIATYTANTEFLGNNVHDSGTNCEAGLPGNGGGGIYATQACKLYHAVYIAGGNNDFDFGWNTVAHIHGGQTVQTHSSNVNEYGISIHDNIIYDTQATGINLDTIDPSEGTGIQVFNNLLYDVGTGPPLEGCSMTIPVLLHRMGMPRMGQILVPGPSRSTTTRYTTPASLSRAIPRRSRSLVTIPRSP